MTKQSDKLESKVWYRISKVVYFTAYIFAFMVVALISWTVIPRNVVDNTKSQIICTGSGKVYSLEDASMSIWDGHTEFNNYEDLEVRRLCATGSIFGELSSFLPDKNYELKISKTMDGSWDRFVEYSFGSLAAMIVIFEIIRRVFIYIVVGNRE